tara:strand:- start:390 stop:851 length:462 start_codon:yes stop_codon:yes gene_type:complete
MCGGGGGGPSRAETQARHEEQMALQREQMALQQQQFEENLAFQRERFEQQQAAASAPPPAPPEEIAETAASAADLPAANETSGNMLGTPGEPGLLYNIARAAMEGRITGGRGRRRYRTDLMPYASAIAPLQISTMENGSGKKTIKPDNYSSSA